MLQHSSHSGPDAVDLVARVAVVPQYATLEVARQIERHYGGRPRGDTFISIAIETYSALLSQIETTERDCARRAFSEYNGSYPSTSVLVTWFSQGIAATLHGAQARAIHAHVARLEATSSLLSTLPASAIISTWDLMAIVGSS